MKICIYDKNIPRTILSQLESRGFFLLATKNLNRISSSLSTHPDIQVCKITGKKIVVEPSVFEYYEKNLDDYGIIVKKGNREVGNMYPYDSIYNCASNGEIAIHNFKITDHAILEELEFEKIKKIHSKQGYGKCNSLFTKDGVITSDMGIYKSLGHYRKLLISPGFIDLDGFEYGFIGGTSGYLDRVYFIGNIKNHPDYLKIKEFLEDEGTGIGILGDMKLRDFGSLIFLDNEEETI